MTKNNQKTYERPTLQVLFVETESVMAGSEGYGTAGAPGAPGAPGEYIDGEDY